MVKKNQKTKKTDLKTKADLIITDTLHKILESAKSVFGSLGYSKATIQKITEKAGVGKGTFYVYFKTKEDIVKLMITEMMNTVLYILERAVERINSEKINFEKFLNELILATLKEYFELKDIIITITYSDYELSKDLVSFKNKNIQKIHNKVKELLEIAINKKYIRKINIDVVSQLMVSLFMNFSIEVLFKEGISRLSYYVKTISDFILNGIRYSEERI